jgi:arrestin-related trafficking adapter 1
MPLLIPHLHSPLHKSPNTQPSNSTARPSSLDLARPLLSKKHNSSPNAPTLSQIKEQPRSEQQKIKLECTIESPPVVLYGPPSESTGSLLSGLFKLHVLTPTPISVKSVYLAVVQKVRCKKAPRHLHYTNNNINNNSNNNNNQDDCSCIASAELARWDVLPHPAELPTQTHAYPFSHILPGSLPATSKNNVFSVDYVIVAKVILADSNKPVSLLMPLTISRSIIKANERNSIRVFPPTELTSTMVLPSVVYPNSIFSVEMALVGIAISSTAKSPWRMRKINWRIDETVKMKNPNYKTTNSGSNSGDDKQEFIDTRIVASGEFKDGWKTEFTGKGKVEMILSDLNTKTLCCNIEDPVLGLSVGHVLVVEIVVAEETLTMKNGSRIAAFPTGAARVLRMQFNLIVTERSGLGISWDDEVPPTYADVPLSPPDYAKVTGALPRFEDVPTDGYVDGINERLSLAHL